LATSSTGSTAFGARFINETDETLTALTVQLTGELWRQSNLPKTLQCYYFIDPTGSAPFSGNQTAMLPALSLAFPVSSSAVGGVAVDGTSNGNQTNLSVVAQPIADWPPGTALWLVWQMTDVTGKAQGLAIDNLSFSSSTQAPAQVPLTFQTTTTNLVLSWIGLAGQKYEVQYKDDLRAPSWTGLGGVLIGTGATLSFTNDFSDSSQRFYRLQLLP
jgi:hypothetical protein